MRAIPSDQAPKGAGLPDVDLLGIGFGPSNLSLAIAIEEGNQELPRDQRLTARFIESKPRFGWHNGMLLPGTTMQISFLKDLVSLRTPTSPYTFLSYLHDRKRLSDFINLKTFYPTRQEFHDYLVWAAERVSLPVSYGMAATRIDWQAGRFVVTTATRAGAAETVTARNIVMGMGLRAVLPPGIVPGPRMFHNHELLPNLAKIPSRTNRRFLVVGSGQSAAEVAAYLHETYPDAEVHAALRRFGYSTSDDTPYANRIFDPAAVDEFYTAPPDLKQRLLECHWLTNYSAVDADLINELYRREYDESVRGTRRLHIHRTTEIGRFEEALDGVTVTLRDLGDRHSAQIKVDAVVLATGFQPSSVRDLLGPTIDAAGAFDGDLPVVDRDYGLRLPVAGRIYLNGGVEHSHGLSSALLSNVPMRSADILNAVVADGGRGTQGAHAPYATVMA
ncbi:MAG: SidA/IucD/PvdA family monooxygenase [Azospirillaceae bacterium]|nr:SidA/IucD/PvdA family monooxygenase [Azospirillaceae bacterium]